jgi:hypothetical protein
MPPPVTDEAKISVRPLSAKDRPGLHAPSMPTPRPLAQPAAPRPRLAGQENASTQGFPGGASPHQKIGVVPLGLAGKDVQRVHNRPEQPQESGGQQPPAPPIATEDIVRAAIEESGKQLPVQP